MSSIRFYNAKILTLYGDKKIIDGELWTKDDRIALVGEATVPLPSFTKEIDAHGNLLLPGFVNAHAHSPMVFLRSFADDLPLQEWLHQQIFPMEARLTEAQAYEFTKLAILEYLSSGITTVFDMYLFPYAIAKASAEMGFRNVLCGGLNDFTHSMEELEEQYLQLNDYHPLISMHLGFHGEYTTSLPLLQGVAKLAEKYKAPVFTHLSETKTEVDDCLARTGKTPPQYLYDLGIWNHGGGGFHCVHTTPEDQALFREHNLATITCPGSNVKLASGIPSLVPMADYPVAIGTDGAASNNALDMFREMYLTATLQKLKENDAAAIPPELVLGWATAGGSHILRLNDTDTLSVGNQADLVMIDLQQPNMQPQHNLIKNIVYSGSKSNVLLTMIAGEIRYHQGEYFVGQSPQEIYATCQNIVADLLSQTKDRK